MEFDLQTWIRERDEAACSFDVKQFKAFYDKYAKMGIYAIELPPDNVLEATMRYMVLGMENPPEDKAKAAKAWLESRGMKPKW